MTVQGIIIEDKINKMLIGLPAILNEVENGSQFYWSILFLEVIGKLGKGISVPIFQEQILHSEKGLLIKWDDLKSLSNKFEQLIDITLIGCKDMQLIQRYEDDQEAFETCDIVIQMIDGGFWEIFSKDTGFINRLGSRFQEVEHVQSDYLTNYLNRKSKGIKIEDSANKGKNVNLSAILSEINGKGYYWSILYIEANGVGQELTISNIQKGAKQQNGYFIGWENLKFFSAKLEQVINMTILCDKAAQELRHYNNLQDQCEACETIIKRIDDRYWEIFSKDAGVIERLSAKFQYVEFLDPNCTKTC